MLSLNFPFDEAEAFPDNIRHGYISCAVCHVSPSGGGILTLYGRGLSESLATFSYEGQGSFLGLSSTDEIKDPTGLIDFLRFDLQLDQRYISVRRDEAEAISFPMQTSASAAIHVKDTATVSVSGGAYGPDRLQELREAWLSLRLSRWVSVRAGRFLPTYGIMTDNHRLWHRSALGFDQGSEQIGVEIANEDKIFQTSLAYMIGREATAVFSPDASYLDTREARLILTKLGVKAGKTALLGVQGMYRAWDEMNTEATAGAFISWAPFGKYGYFLGEVDYVRRNREPAIDDELFLFGRVGSEPLRGVLAWAQAEGRRREGVMSWRFGPGVRLAVTPHVSFGVDGEFSEESKTLLLLSHVWL